MNSSLNTKSDPKQIFLSEDDILEGLGSLKLEPVMKDTSSGERGITGLMFKVVDKDPSQGDRLTKEEFIRSCKLLDIAFVIKS
jgi:hypothetical protein